MDNPGLPEALPKGLREKHVLISTDPYPRCAPAPSSYRTSSTLPCFVTGFKLSAIDLLYSSNVYAISHIKL